MTEPMTPERRRETLIRRYSARYPENDTSFLIALLDDTRAEVDRLQAENKRAMECFDRDQKVIADLHVENARLRAQVAAGHAHAYMATAGGSLVCTYCGALASDDEEK